MGNGKDLSQFVCPLCAKFNSIRLYDSSDYVDDIYAVQVRGLGKGRGVEVIDTYSLLEEEAEVVEKIADRVLEIFTFLYDNEWISEEDVRRVLGDSEEET